MNLSWKCVLLKSYFKKVSHRFNENDKLILFHAENSEEGMTIEDNK